MRGLKISKSITPRDQKSLEKYLKDISQYEVLTPQEELRLFLEYRGGSELAKEQIINCNLRFVVSVAKKYMNLGLPLNDLINEGNEGLIVAAERFDESKGFKFISYAVWWIRQRIIQAINVKGRKIRTPQNQSSRVLQLLNLKSRLAQELERTPTEEELAVAAEISVKEVKRCFEANQLCRSLDAPVGYEDEGSSLGNLMVDESIQAPDDQLVQHESAQIQVGRLLNCLSDSESRILSMAYGINNQSKISFGEIAEQFDISKERVRQICNRSIQKLRKRAESSNMVPILN
ncbi:MAG: RNA polymerase sigma factor RpoD/SigA [Saprospiraceae bacterium]|nr:RNA polymerase sigma factor RpoD/SigA [Saprospiraceae bacterium]